MLLGKCVDAPLRRPLPPTALGARGRVRARVRARARVRVRVRVRVRISRWRQVAVPAFSKPLSERHVSRCGGSTE